jgi:hypothetical protein
MSSAARSLPPDVSATPQPTPAPLPAYTDAFWRALLTLRDRGVSENLAVRALQTWTFLAHAGAPEATIEIVREEAVRFTWSYGDLYLHVDVRSNGYEWFFEDDTAKRYEGNQEDVVTELPPAFFAGLTVIAARRPA